MVDPIASSIIEIRAMVVNCELLLGKPSSGQPYTTCSTLGEQVSSSSSEVASLLWLPYTKALILLLTSAASW